MRELQEKCIGRKQIDQKAKSSLKDKQYKNYYAIRNNSSEGSYVHDMLDNGERERT